MKGEKGTLEDIQRNVRNGLQEMGDVARQGAREIGDAVRGPKGSEFGKILLIVIGIAFLLSGVSGLASVSVLSLAGNGTLHLPLNTFLSELYEEAPIFYDMLDTPWILVLAILAVILPLIGLIYLGIRFIFGFKAPSWKPGLVILVLWLVILVVLAVLGFAGIISTEYMNV